jgi:hypothetical protein
MLADSQKRPRVDDREPGSGPPNTLSQQAPIAARDGATSSALSHADYPKVKYWTKQAWEDAERKKKKKDSSGMSGPRGGGRSAKRENVGITVCIFAFVS